MSALRKKATSPAVQDRWMSVRAAAAELGIAPQTVLQRALEGKLTTERAAGRTIVLRASVEDLKSAHAA